MAKFWSSFAKFIQCVETYCNPVSNIKIFSKNCPSMWRIFENLDNKSLFTLFPFCGFIGSKEKSKSCHSEEEVLHNISMATLALKDGDIQKSEKLFTETLNLAETNNFTSTVISACDILSSLAIKLGDYEKAEDYLIKALNNLLGQGAAENNNAVISFNLKLSRLYWKNGNDSLAEMGFKNCIKLLEEKMENNYDDQDSLLLWATVLYWYGKFLVQKVRYEEAKKCFEDSYLTSKKTERMSPSQVAVLLYNLGEVCRLLGEESNAVEHFLKGASIAEKLENPDLAYFYHKIGEIFLSKKLYKEAKVWCDVAQKYATKSRNHEAEVESKECLDKLNNILMT